MSDAQDDREAAMKWTMAVIHDRIISQPPLDR